MFVTSYSVTYCIYVLGKPGICFHYYYAVYDECKYSDTFWLADHTRLIVQYTISLSSLCKLIWRHWTNKMPVRYIWSSVWVRLSIFSPLSIIQMCGCKFSVYPFPLWWLREYIYLGLLSSSNRKYELISATKYKKFCWWCKLPRHQEPLYWFSCFKMKSSFMDHLIPMIHDLNRCNSIYGEFKQYIKRYDMVYNNCYTDHTIIGLHELSVIHRFFVLTWN